MSLDKNVYPFLAVWRNFAAQLSVKWHIILLEFFFLFVSNIRRSTSWKRVNIYLLVETTPSSFYVRTYNLKIRNHSSQKPNATCREFVKVMLAGIRFFSFSTIDLWILEMFVRILAIRKKMESFVLAKCSLFAHFDINNFVAINFILAGSVYK